jgi:hypothetical protein
MTSNAVTASMCASASDVAFFVATFMPFPPWTLDTTRRCARTHATSAEFLFGTPRVDVRFASPHSASIDGSKDRLVMRRQLGSVMVLLRRCVGNV